MTIFDLFNRFHDPIVVFFITHNMQIFHNIIIGALGQYYDISIVFSGYCYRSKII